MAQIIQKICFFILFISDPNKKIPQLKQTFNNNKNKARINRTILRKCITILCIFIIYILSWQSEK